MSLGLGHKYWVHVLKYFYGSLEECISFMDANKPDNSLSWFELRPVVDVKKGSCKEYMCSLVEIDK